VSLRGVCVWEGVSVGGVSVGGERRGGGEVGVADGVVCLPGAFSGADL
jgi:hypothetical protein